MGFIRQAALGEALKPWEDRVNPKKISWI
jgi:hypothetical protein